jgi:hypothetical protein
VNAADPLDRQSILAYPYRCVTLSNGGTLFHLTKKVDLHLTGRILEGHFRAIIVATETVWRSTRVSYLKFSF